MKKIDAARQYHTSCPPSIKGKITSLLQAAEGEEQAWARYCLEQTILTELDKRAEEAKAEVKIPHRRITLPKPPYEE